MRFGLGWLAPRISGLTLDDDRLVTEKGACTLVTSYLGEDHLSRPRETKINALPECKRVRTKRQKRRPIGLWR